jgi:hypothetical protein
MYKGVNALTPWCRFLVLTRLHRFVSNHIQIQGTGVMVELDLPTLITTTATPSSLSAYTVYQSSHNYLGVLHFLTQNGRFLCI